MPTNWDEIAGLLLIGFAAGAILGYVWLFGSLFTPLSIYLSP